MNRSDTVLRHFKTVGANAAVDNKDLDIISGETIIFKMIDFTAPAQESAGVKVIFDPLGTNIIIAASQGDKVLHLPPGQSITGPAKIRLQLDNSNNPNGALLGVAVYYEKV